MISKKKLMWRQKSELEGERKIPNVFPESNNARNNLFLTPEQAQLMLLDEVRQIRQLLQDLKNNTKS